MTDINLWQQTLEPSGYVVNADKLATDLYECSLIIFLGLIRQSSTESAFLQHIRTQLQRFRLWGSDFDAQEGGLDERIVNSDRLKDVLLPILGRMADALVKIARRRSQDIELEEVILRVRLLNEQSMEANVQTAPGGEDVEPEGLQLTLILDDITSSGSEDSIIDEPREIDELLQDVGSSNDCLFKLGSVLQDSAESIVPNPGNVHGSTAVNLSLLRNIAWPYISNILETYPSLDRDFARRLGEANERRYNRLQTQRNKTATKDNGSENDISGEKSGERSSHVQISRQASTGSVQSNSTDPSTKISSVFDNLTSSAPNPTRGKTPRAALSVTTFASSLSGNEGQNRGRGLPKMPDDQPWGTPFSCTVCGDTLSNVWSSVDWVRHVYRDLQPYICTFPACSEEHDAFVSRHEWSAHEFHKHRKYMFWACGQCDPGKSNFTSEAQLRNHFAKDHPALGPHHVASVMRSARESRAKRITWKRCPFCLVCPASTPAQYFSHVGRHLQEVAHAAIPMSLMSKDTESLEGLEDSDDEVQGERVLEKSTSMAGSRNRTASAENAEVDPRLQIFLRGTIRQIISIITKVVKSLNEIRESKRNIGFSTALVPRQLSSIRATLEALEPLQQFDNVGTEATEQLDKDLRLSLSCCAILVTVIESKLTESGYTPGIGTKDNIRYTWLEDTLEEYISNLESQVLALQLLLAICYCRTSAEQRQQLTQVENREIIEQMVAETMEIDNALSTLKQDSSVHHLDVDKIFMKSLAYKRVMGETQVEGDPGKSSITGGQLSTTASIIAITHLLKRLSVFGNNTYTSKHQNADFSESVGTLMEAISALQLHNERIVKRNTSGPGYADLSISSRSWRQTEQELDIEKLEKVRSSIKAMLHKIRLRHGLGANLSWSWEKRDCQRTIEKVYDLTEVVHGIVDDAQRITLIADAKRYDDAIDLVV